MRISWIIFLLVVAHQAFAAGENYLIIDVSGGSGATNYPVSYQASEPVYDSSFKTSKIVLRRLPGGSFYMGSPSNELGRDLDETQHWVTQTTNCYAGVFEITQAQYANVMGTNPSTRVFAGAEHPVESVGWGDVRGGEWPGSPAGSGMPSTDSFVGRLSVKTGLALDLPTEAQWEYACRAGTVGALNLASATPLGLSNTYFYWMLGELGWHWGMFLHGSSGIDVGSHMSVGLLLTNKWGLFDLHGNVAEWCLDWYTNLSATAVTNPVGPAEGTLRVIRGGSWRVRSMYCRSACRDALAPTKAWAGDGFRLWCPAPEPPTQVTASDGAYINMIRITWTPGSHATKYALYRHTTNVPAGAVNISSTLTTTNYDDTAVISGTTYWYWVKGHNAGEWSAFSPGNSGYAASMPGSGVPFVDVTNASVTVAAMVTNYVVAGTNNASVMGGMWVTNLATGGTATKFPATASWTAPAVALATGTNTIMVCGTNAFGILANDSVAVIRRLSSFIVLTNPAAVSVIVPYTQTQYRVVATNAEVVGEIGVVVNHRTTNWHAAANSFAGDVTLQVGPNLVRVIGTNSAGLWLSDTAMINRRNTNSSLVAWGLNSSGQTNCPAGDTYVEVASRGAHNVTLTSNGRVVAWGNNGSGQTNCPAGDDHVAVAAGYSHSIALRADGTLVAWGDNSFGQIHCPAGSGYVAVVAGGYHTTALREDGTLVSWGRNDFGQTNCPSDNQYVAVAAGYYHSVALRADGVVVAWGCNQFQETNCPAGNSYLAVAGGGNHSVALRADGSLVAWGYNGNGQTSCPAGTGYVAIGAGYAHSIAVNAEGNAVAWGWNNYGQTNCPAGNDYLAVAGGGNHSVALRKAPAINTACVFVNAAGGSWTNADNWLDGKIAGAGCLADFSTLDLPADATVRMDGNHTVAAMKLNDTAPSANWLIVPGSPASTLTLDTTNGGPYIDVMAQTTMVSAAVSGILGFQKWGAGVLWLTAVNDALSGTVVVSNGVLKLSGSGTLGAAVVNVTSGALCEVDTSAGHKTIMNDISGSGAIMKSGGNMLILQGNNTFSGSISINAGFLMLDGAGTEDGMPAVALGGGNLYLGNAFVTALCTLRSLSGSGGVVSPGYGATAGVRTLGLVQEDNTVFAGNLVDASANRYLSLTKLGGGTLTLAGGGAYASNTMVCGGTLNIEGGLYTNVYRDGSTRITVSNAVLQVRELTTNAASSLGQLSANTYEPHESEPTQGTPVPDTTHLLFNGGTNRIAGGTHAHRRGFIAASGGCVIEITNAQTTVTWWGREGAHQDIYAWGPLELGGAGNGVINDKIIKGTASLRKTGTGVWILNNMNAYSGETRVDAGLLVVHGVVGGGTVDVGAAGMIAGTGTISGNAVVSGTLSPGPSIGTLRIGGDAALNAGATTRLEINRSSSPAGDKLSVNGTLTCGGTLLVTNIGPDLQIGDSFDLFDGTILGAFGTIDLPALATGQSWDTSRLYSDGEISVAMPVLYVDEFIVRHGADYGQIALFWSNGLIAVLCCTNRAYPSNPTDQSNWFVLADGVTSPWTHTAASNFPSVYYRLVSGVRTSRYDVGKYDIDIAPGSVAWISFPFDVQPGCSLLSDWFGHQLEPRQYSLFSFPSLQKQIEPGGTIQNSDYYIDEFGTGDTNWFPDRAVAANIGCVLFLPQDHGAVKLTGIGMVPTNSVTMQVPYTSVPWVGLAYPISLDMRNSGLPGLLVPPQLYSQFDYDYIDSQTTPGSAIQSAEYYVDNWVTGATNFFPSITGADRLEAGKGYLLFFSTTRSGTGVWTCIRPY